MATTNLLATPTHFLGPRTTPQDVRDFRQNILDFHKNEGYPVIHKHRWNEKDLREGRVQQCPLHDDLYDSDLTWDPVCFGTGYVGGWADGQIMFVSLTDAPTDVIKRSKEGLLIMDSHPQLTAPWYPEIGDNDLIILADFEPGTWDIKDLHDRYVIQEVEPVTMRGPYFSQQQRNAVGRPLRVGQKSNIDKLPYGHRYYDVPVIFDPADVPPDVVPPGPDQPPDGVGTYTEFSTSFGVNGKFSGIEVTTEREFEINTVGDNATMSAEIHIKGIGEGTIVHLT